MREEDASFDIFFVLRQECSLKIYSILQYLTKKIALGSFTEITIITFSRLRYHFTIANFRAIHLTQFKIRQIFGTEFLWYEIVDIL